ncbi:unnamed protein product [Ilex paraguariensis]|uniref:H15 domain-containing protein n=1 Tax=Ilex paraguariensis TaxID=185542 RepID=A0ABC8SPV0_9AQUA
MDPGLDPPATDEPAVHIAYAANPTPSHAVIHNHPPYAEMITTAITALKERNGSSRTAIAKYIDKEYSNLPPSHSALLTHHLKRLRNTGQLVMVKHSYMLPRSVPPGNNANGYAPSSDGPKRGPGRPPKPNPNANLEARINPGEAGSDVYPPTAGLEAHINPGVLGSDVYAPVSGHEAHINPGVLGSDVYSPSSSGSKRGPGRPPKPKTNTNHEAQINPGVVGSEAMLFSLGLVDGPPPMLAKRGPGRPQKVKTRLVGVESGGRMLTKRGPGRPPRPKSLSVVLGQGGPKRGPGRPPRSGPRGVVAGVKPRGRPKKDGSSTVKRPGRPRGRPLKIVAVAVGSGGDAAAGLGPLSNDGKVLPGKRRGRPPMAAGPKMPRKFTGKPLGRPRKVNSFLFFFCLPIGLQEKNSKTPLDKENAILSTVKLNDQVSQRPNYLSTVT